jgi:hypothetical protein
MGASVIVYTLRNINDSQKPTPGKIAHDTDGSYSRLTGR